MFSSTLTDEVQLVIYSYIQACVITALYYKLISGAVIPALEDLVFLLL